MSVERAVHHIPCCSTGKGRLSFLYVKARFERDYAELEKTIGSMNIKLH